MTSKSCVKMRLFIVLMPILFAGCKSTIDKYTLSSCKAVETNIAKCSRLIADDISNKNANILSSVDERDL